MYLSQIAPECSATPQKLDAHMLTEGIMPLPYNLADCLVKVMDVSVSQHDQECRALASYYKPIGPSYVKEHGERRVRRLLFRKHSS